MLVRFLLDNQQEWKKKTECKGGKKLTRFGRHSNKKKEKSALKWILKRCLFILLGVILNNRV